MAKLYFRYGAMNSGKSTALMQVAHNYEEQGMRVLILEAPGGHQGRRRTGQPPGRAPQGRPAHPARGGCVRGRARRFCRAQPLACVLCDESQFFTPAQAEQLFMVTVDLNIPVICYGLRSDFSPQRASPAPPVCWSWPTPLRR